MSAFYDLASLVVVPSGYKTSKVYAQKPLTTDGQLAFTRSTNATRVGPDGLIEKVRTNLVLQSNTFSNAAWVKTGATTLTAGQADYLGGTNAWKWESNAIATIQLGQSVTTSAASANHSIFAKAGSVTSFSIWIGSAVTFDLSAGTITAGSGTITSVGNGWYRCSVNRTTVSSTNTLNPYFAAASAGDYIFISFAQTEENDIATSYIATTSAAVSVGPVANVPRLDYLNSSCPKLLLEPSRTNMARNWNLTAATWDKTDVTATATSGIAPTGNNEAYKITPISSGSDRFFYDDGGSAGYTASADYTNTIFAKAAGVNWCYARFEIKGNTSSFVYFNIATGAVGSTTGSVPMVKSIENYGNGWYRIRVTGNIGTGIGGNNNVLFGICDADGSTYVTASGSNGVLFFGPQSEQGSYPTSAIPTLGAAVTRGADACSKTGISSLIGQTEGTFFADFVWTKVNKTYQSILLGATSNYNNTVYLLTTESSGAASYQLRIGGATAIATISTTFTTGTRYKIALAYKSGSIAFYVNGISVGTSSATYGAVSEAISQFRYDWPYGGDEQWCSPVNQTLLFKTRLTNAQLAELTTI